MKKDSRMVRCPLTMRSSFGEAARPGNSGTSSLMGAVHHKILDMGVQIRSKFRLDNIHITGTERLDGINKITDAVGSLSKLVQSQSKQIDDLFQAITDLRGNMTDVHEAVSTPVKSSGQRVTVSKECNMAPVESRLVPSSFEESTTTCLTVQF